MAFERSLARQLRLVLTAIACASAASLFAPAFAQTLKGKAMVVDVRDRLEQVQARGVGLFDHVGRDVDRLVLRTFGVVVENRRDEPHRVVMLLRRRIVITLIAIFGFVEYSLILVLNASRLQLPGVVDFHEPGSVNLLEVVPLTLV